MKLIKKRRKKSVKRLKIDTKHKNQRQIGKIGKTAKNLLSHKKTVKNY